MEYLKQENYSDTLSCLQKAQNFTQQDPTGMATTCNNFACFYRQQGKLHMSLKYLKRALKIGDASKDAETYVNLCAVLSEMGYHTAALQYAQSALEILEDELFDDPENANMSNGGMILKGNNIDNVDLDRISMLVITYYNIGSEH